MKNVTGTSYHTKIAHSEQEENDRNSDQNRKHSLPKSPHTPFRIPPSGLPCTQSELSKCSHSRLHYQSIDKTPAPTPTSPPTIIVGPFDISTQETYYLYLYTQYLDISPPFFLSCRGVQASHCLDHPFLFTCHYRERY